MDDRQDLRHHQGGHTALQQAGHDEHVRVGGDAAEERGRGEPGDADEEDALAAVDVTETAAGDQACGEGEGIARGDPLDRAGGGAEVLTHGADGYVDDRDVDQVHEGRGHHDGERQPAAAVGGRAGCVVGYVVPLFLYGPVLSFGRCLGRLGAHEEKLRRRLGQSVSYFAGSLDS